MNYIKKEKDFDREYIQKLKKYLKDHPAYLFSERNKAVKQNDFETTDIKTDNKHLVKRMEYCISMFYGTELWIARHMKRLQKIGNKYMDLMPAYKITDNCTKLVGKNFNGVALMPEIEDDNIEM